MNYLTVFGNFFSLILTNAHLFHVIGVAISESLDHEHTPPTLLYVDHHPLLFAFFKNTAVILSYWVLVAHTYNPGYSRCRDQEDHGSKPAQENSSQDPISKKTHHKKGLVEWLKV
jgi:hypothetical protein